MHSRCYEIDNVQKERRTREGDRASKDAKSNKRGKNGSTDEVLVS